MKKLAFTLAEILITLTVIGVVAIMVLPNMIGHSEKKTLETQTKHFYSMMSLAVQNYMADIRVDDLTETPIYCERFEENCDRANKELNSFIMKYLKVALVCENITQHHNSSRNACYRQTAKVIDKTSDLHGEYTPDYILANGYAINVDVPGASDGTVRPMRLLVDVNGQHGPNRGGRDIWDLWVHYDGTINEKVLTPDCMSNSNCARREINNNFYSNCLTSYLGTGCFGRFRDQGFKFDY